MTATDVVTFRVDQALYGVAVDRVREILDLRPISPMPNAPAYLLGITDLRGDNIPVVDLRLLLGLPGAADTPQTRILVTHIAHGADRAVVGLRTDRVIEVTRLDDDILRPLAEAELLRWHGTTIAGIGRRNGEVVSIIALDRLFDGIALSESQPDLQLDPRSDDPPAPHVAVAEPAA